MIKGNAHLLNASVAKRMRELRLDVAGRIYTQQLAPYAKLPHDMELGIHARNALKAAEVLLAAEGKRSLPGEARTAMQLVVARFTLLYDSLLEQPIPQPTQKALHDMADAVQTLVGALK